VRGDQGASLSSETASVGRRRGGSICARGTERFDGAGREENLARARTYRQHVREHAEAELAKFVNGDLAGADWWSGQPEGTSRTLEIEASRARSGSLSLLRALRIAPEASIVARGAVRLTRGAGTLLEVVLTRTIDATGGAIGGQIVGVAGGQTAHYTVRDVYVVDLAVDGSAASLSGFLETLAGFESGARGVRHTLHSVETSTGEYIGVDVAVVGGLRGGDNTGTIETTRYAENGDVVDTTRVHTSDDYFVGNTVTGHDSRRRRTAGPALGHLGRRRGAHPGGGAALSPGAPGPAPARADVRAARRTARAARDPDRRRAAHRTGRRGIPARARAPARRARRGDRRARRRPRAAWHPGGARGRGRYR
jgi:hypothetical protein